MATAGGRASCIAWPRCRTGWISIVATRATSVARATSLCCLRALGCLRALCCLRALLELRQLEATAVLLRHQRLRQFGVGDAQVLGVPLDALAGSQRQVSEQDRLGERRGILKVGHRLRVAEDALQPFVMDTGRT